MSLLFCANQNYIFKNIWARTGKGVYMNIVSNLYSIDAKIYVCHQANVLALNINTLYMKKSNFQDHSRHQSFYVACEMKWKYIWRQPGHQALAQDLTYLEFFAGEANVFKCIRADHHPACAVDIRYMPNMPNSPMDINTSAGFLLFGMVSWFQHDGMVFKYIYLTCLYKSIHGGPSCASFSYI